MTSISSRLSRLIQRAKAESQDDAVVAYVRAEFQRQEDMASGHMQQSHFVDRQSGRNIGKDERIALSYLASVNINKTDDDGADPSAYLERILAEVRRAQARYVAVEEDENGFGSATFGEIIVKLEQQLEGSG